MTEDRIDSQAETIGEHFEEAQDQQAAGGDGLAAKPDRTPEEVMDEARDIHIEIGCRRRTNLDDAHRAGKLVDEAITLYKDRGDPLPVKDWVNLRYQGAFRYGTANVYRNVHLYWPLVESCGSIAEARKKISHHKKQERRARRPEGIPGHHEAGLVAPVTREKVKVVLTPGEAARQNLERWWRERLRDLKPEQVMYLAGDGHRGLNYAWKHLLAEIGPLPKVLVPALVRRDEALKELGLGEPVDENEDVSDLGPRAKAIETTFKAELVSGLKTRVEKLTDEQKHLVAFHLGILTNQTLPNRERIGLRLKELLPVGFDADAITHVVGLLSPTPPVEDGETEDDRPYEPDLGHEEPERAEFGGDDDSEP
jgi:hypothetical protein